jgi:hypothetical protein
MKDTQLLSEIGQALYGAHWETTLSRQMAVSDRSMRRWSNGTDKIPWGVWFDVYREVQSRAQNLDHWGKALYERVVIRECESRPEGKLNPDTDWYFEVHDPESGRHSLVQWAVLQSLSDVRAEMKKHPGMIFRVTVPFLASAEEQNEFSKMNIQRI